LETELSSRQLSNWRGVKLPGGIPLILLGCRALTTVITSTILPVEIGKNWSYLYVIKIVIGGLLGFVSWQSLLVGVINSYVKANLGIPVRHIGCNPLESEDISELLDNRVE
jgi:hypothetical protein